MTIEIKNAGPAVAAVLIGDPELPEEVKVLQSGETYHTTAARVSVVDDSYPGLKNRRVAGGTYAGRRVADPNVDQRQIRKLAPAVEKANPPFGEPGHVLQPGEVGYVTPDPKKV